ncbi:MFS transporter [Phycicoccus sp. Root101]|uniref:MFS transporter n=1 Tax=Phycicoccus sp. Root101 TaxID=1736421 RepID=UPI0007035F87|nr:MFS transporter [Phycicoccus sp. Root101]KQU64639.1 MFS transporter [Phycicoccus sp. Root101]
MSAQTVAAPAATPASPTARGPRRRVSPTVVLGVILTAQLMVVLDATIVNVALPRMQTALDFTPTGLSWVLSAYTLAFGGLLLFGARAGDLFGRRRVFLTGMALFAAASFAGGFATTATWLVASRAAQGVGAALAAPAVLALLMSTFPEARERTRALGLFTGVSIGGAAIGLIAGGLLVQWFSWRWVMFVNVPIGLAVIAAALLVVPETPRSTGRIDVAGALSSTLGMTALVYAFVRAAEAGWSDTETIASFVAAAALLVLFVLVERRAAHPIVPLELFANRTRAGSYAGRLLLVAGIMGTFFFTTLFLQDVLHYSPLQTGLGFLPLTAALFLASQLSARRFVEQFGPRRVMVVGTLLSTTALALLSRMSETSSYWSILVPLVLLGLGNGTAFVPLTGASLHEVEPQHAGAASGLVNVTQQVGGSLGLALLVTVFGTASRHAAAAPSHGRSVVEQSQHVFVAGASTALTVAAGLLLLTVVVVSQLHRTPRAARAEVAPAV